MATSKTKKTTQLDALIERFKNAKGVAFIKYFGPTVEDVQNVRRECRANGMKYIVIKKTLMALAAKTAKLAEFSSDNLEGPVAVIVSASDEIAPAAAIKKFKKDFFDKKTKTTKFDFAGSLFEGKFLNEAETAQLADTKTKEESFGAIVSMLRFGPTRIHSALLHGVKGICAACREADKLAKN